QQERYVADEVGAAPLEERMVRHVDEHEEITGGAPALPDVPLPAHLELLARCDAGGDLHLDSFLVLLAALPVALRTAGDDREAAPIAPRAVGSEEPARRRLAGSTARLARLLPALGLRAIAFASLARSEALDLDRALGAAPDLLETQ